MFRIFFKLFKFSIKEIKSQKKIYSFLILNFTFGVLGFLFLQIFNESLMTQIKEKAQDSATSDLTVSVRRIFSESEVKIASSTISFLEKSETKSFFAMAVHKNKSRLVQVIAFDDKYPLYGKYNFKNKGQFSQEKKIWIDKSLVSTFGIYLNSKEQNFLANSIQQSIQIGEVSFNIADVI